MEIFILWLIGTIIVTAMGSDRKIGGLAAFFISLLLSPLVGLIFVLASKRTADEQRENEMLALQRKQAQAAASTPPHTALVADELIKLKQLLDSNVLTEEEYEAQKKRLLNY